MFLAEGLAQWKHVTSISYDLTQIPKAQSHDHGISTCAVDHSHPASEVPNITGREFLVA